MAVFLIGKKLLHHATQELASYRLLILAFKLSKNTHPAALQRDFWDSQKLCIFHSQVMFQQFHFHTVFFGKLHYHINTNSHFKAEMHRLFLHVPLIVNISTHDLDLSEESLPVECPFLKSLNNLMPANSNRDSAKGELQGTLRCWQKVWGFEIILLFSVW